MLYLAIDQHRKPLTVNLRNEEREVMLRRQVSTQWERVGTFFEDLRRRSQPEKRSKGNAFSEQRGKA